MTEISADYSSNLSQDPDDQQSFLNEEQNEDRSKIAQDVGLDLREGIKQLKSRFPAATEDLIVTSLMKNSKKISKGFIYSYRYGPLGDDTSVTSEVT